MAKISAAAYLRMRLISAYIRYKPKKYFSANQRSCLKEPILLQLLVEHKLVSDLL